MTLLATQITEALVAQLQTCTDTEGFETDIGRSVYVGQLRGGAVQAPCLYVLPVRTTDTAAYSDVVELSRRYEIKGFCDANHYQISEPALIDLIAWDIRRCLHAAGTGLTNLVRDIVIRDDSPGYREEGGTLVGASLNVEISYAVDMTDPTTPA
jgi:hypothetical protein